MAYDGLGVLPISMCGVLGRRVCLDKAFKVNLSFKYVKLTSKHVINVDLMTVFKQITASRFTHKYVLVLGIITHEVL